MTSLYDFWQFQKGHFVISLLYGVYRNVSKGVLLCQSGHCTLLLLHHHGWKNIILNQVWNWLFYSDVEGFEEPLVTEIKQTIEYIPVCTNEISSGSILKSTRNFITFDKDGVGRYSVTSAILSSDEGSPCKAKMCNKFRSIILF